MGLESEPIPKSDKNPLESLKKYGCSQAEIDFLVRTKTAPFEGDRFELNAMTSDQFIDWLERKLTENGVTKFIPDQSILAESYRLQVERHHLTKFVEEKLAKEVQAKIEEIKSLPITPPDNLDAAVQDILSKNPLMPWDDAVWQAAKHFEGFEGEVIAS